MSGEPVPFSLFIYAPNKGAPVFFAVAFAISTCFHVWQCRRFNAWKLVGLHPLCGVLFTAGYALREYGAFNYLYKEDDSTNLIIFINSQVFIYICPPLLELANYHVLGRLFYYVPFCAPMPASRVLSVFGGLILLVEVVNSLGVSLSANPSSSPTTQKIGSAMALAAVGLQFCVILAFSYLAYLFHRKCFKRGMWTRPIRIVLYVLYASMTLILIRCIYRLVEHTGHTEINLNDFESLKSLNPILRYEVYFYVFEASLMLVNSVLWNACHPGRFLPAANHIHLSEDGHEVVGTEHHDTRSLLAKLVNTMTFGLLCNVNKSQKAQRYSSTDLSDYPRH